MGQLTGVLLPLPLEFAVFNPKLAKAPVKILATKVMSELPDFLITGNST
jgi:hypothetical protein